MSLSERIFDTVTQFPAWLESFDALQIPGWGVLLTMAIAGVGLVFAVREFLSWFLKTNSIIDEVVRLEAQIRDLQGDLAALEATVERLQGVAGDVTLAAASPAPQKETPIEPMSAKPQFRLDM